MRIRVGFTPILREINFNDAPTWLSWSNDGNRLLHGFLRSEAVYIRNAETGGRIARLHCDGAPSFGHWSHDDASVSVVESRRITVRESKTGKVLRERGALLPKFAVWNPTSHLLAINDGDDVKIFDGKTFRGVVSHQTVGDFVAAVWTESSKVLVAQTHRVTSVQTDGLVNFTHPTKRCRAIAATSRIIAIADDTRVVIRGAPTDIELVNRAAPVTAISFSHDGAVLAVLNEEGDLDLWNTQSWEHMDVWETGAGPYNSLQFSPTSPVLAVTSERSIIIYDCSNLTSKRQSVRYTTAKIALVGDSGVGKTGLGWRLTHDLFKETASTHGEQFWVADRLSTTRADGTRCEAILWDLAGQPDYRIIHALFLNDADLALIVFDPTNRQDPLKGVEFWLRALGAKEQRCRTMLVAGRVDRGSGAITREEVEAFGKAHGVTGGYVTTSALRGEGVDELVQRVQALIEWDQRPATVTTATFKEIKDHILALKESEASIGVLVTLEELRETLRERTRTTYDERDVAAATKHLANHGYVRDLRNSAGAQFILLAPDLLNNLASSMVLEARRNPKGLGALNERRLLAGEYDFPELAPLAPREREILLDAAATLFIAHNICFRETLGSDTFLIFPSLINQNRPPLDDVPVIDGTAYTATGATEHVYAALVVLLGYTNTFTRTAQWRNHAQYEMGSGQLCGFRLTEEREGEIDLVLYFGNDTAPATRQLFQSLFEKFLRLRHVQVEVFRRVDCLTCGYTQPRSEVIKRQRHETQMMFCANCGAKILLADAPSTASAPEAVAREQGTASQRTQFETALTTLKSYLRDTRADQPSPSCFVSYAWGNPQQERWVERSLATDLRNAGVHVILDRWHATPASSLTKFIEQVGSTDFVAVVGTPRLRAKYDAQQGDPVVAAELKMIGTRLRKSSKDDTIVPLLLEGEHDTSFPPFAEDSIAIDFRNEDLYFERIFDLLLTLYRIPFDEPAMHDLRDTIRDAADRRRRR